MLHVLIFVCLLVLGEFPPVEPTDYRAKAFRGIRVDCNTPSYYPGTVLPAKNDSDVIFCLQSN